ncbi:DNA repair protein RecN [Anaeromyxobacter diazotrophicus]|uniref:DNA repair protein RecN n=1 Tax=Anaeromyxobacter diazotrophicus TaxID=2590199 RepID=A0A7I9VG64_9BACT|nr:DNA repair protein RecN [Anaeromyxobacter diazotrophicus]GEJ55373.1 DNA repair protein RecN [Anaeromyxobacter diazotrophicus]
MLTTLRISGLAVVDQVEVAFGPGLNVLTGETGAGKSILLQALHLVLGGRMSAEALREGADEAVVEALFELPARHPALARLEAAGLPVPAAGGEVLVRRVATRSGRGRAFVNGALCTVGMLEGALRGLVDLTGQHEHVALLDEASHLSLLDAFAGVDGEGGLLASYRAAFQVLQTSLRRKAELLAAREERARRADWLAYQLREIDAAAPRPGEDAELDRERQVLAAAERLRAAAREAEAAVYAEEGSAAERVGRAARSLAEAVQLDPRLEPALALLRSAGAELDEAGRLLARYAEAVTGDPERLAEVVERLELLRALARKHGGSVAEALARAAAMRAELAQAEGAAGELERLERAAEEAGRAARALAAALSEARREAAAALGREVRQELAALAMARCRVSVEFLAPEGAVDAAGAALGREGAERARILIAPNPGEPPRPLARVASGGELSRLLLALKRALARTDPVDTYVFDEVDAGIGGAVADAVGRLLSEVSRERQVVCVTHLPQVAAFADLHLRVEKRVQAGRTATGVVPLAAPDARRAELARMLAGATLTPSAVEHAGALLAAARAAAAASGEAPVTGRRGRPVRSAARRAGKVRLSAQ